MRNKMLLIISMFVSSCGGEHNVHVNDVTVTHKIMVDLKNLEQYFRPECEKLYTNTEDIQDCISNKVGDFLEKTGL